MGKMEVFGKTILVNPLSEYKVSNVISELSLFKEWQRQMHFQIVFKLRCQGSTRSGGPDVGSSGPNVSDI